MTEEIHNTEIVKVDERAITPVKQERGQLATVETQIAELIEQSGTIEFTKKQKEILFAPIEEEIIEIRPDGLIYLPWMEYVTRLRDAFSGKYALIPSSRKPEKQNDLLLWGFYLMVDGKPYGYAIGEQEYHANNPTMSWGDACEGAKSNALMRLCKGLGIGLELWRPSFIEAWKKKYAESYWSEKKGKYLWRKKSGIRDEGQSSGEDALKEPSTGRNNRLAESSPTTEKTGIRSTKMKVEFQNDEVAKEALEKVAFEYKKEANDIAYRINLALRKATIDPKDFKKWLKGKQVERKFVGEYRGNPSFREGNIEDLRYLESVLEKIHIPEYLDERMKK